MHAIVESDATLTPPQMPAVLTVDTLTGPDRVRVTTDGGAVAVFTPGARTVAISGLAKRTFSEIKRVGPATADLFARTRSSRWGLSPYYGSWSAPVGGVNTDWKVTAAGAQVLVDSANVSRFVSLRDQDVIDYRLRVPVSLASMPAGASSSIAVTANYVDTSNHYRYRLTVTTTGTVQLAIDRVSGGATTVVAASVTIGSGYAAGQTWWIIAEQSGATISCMAHKDGDTPPAAWQRTFTDPSPLGPGRVGIRAFLSPGAATPQTFTLRQFEITSGRWAHPPVVTHDTWVRLLPAPFAGWDADVEQWLRAAVCDTTPDVLARAMSYVTGATRVYDPQYGAGRWVLGQADYGPNNADGSRVEGADFNDYIRTSWSYPHLAVPSTDINEIAQQGCLDCSGYVRMVYGYWHGIPMSLTDPADLNGLNLPRRSVQIGPAGPGVLVSTGVTDPAALNVIQIGDVTAFNADVADDVAGEESGDIEETDDHVGIYIGRDPAGNYLFVSSRKTANGPTFSALGGPSYLNGSGTWAVSLRHIRRF